MATEKLYVKDVYMKSAAVVLQQIKTDEKGGVSLAFDASPFFPEGGGQPCDLGTIGEYKVVDVKEEKGSGVVWHRVEIPEGGQMPVVGNTYAASIDWNRRFRNMQMHCGEHIISAAFLKLYGGANKGFHMGEDYVTIDIGLPEGSPYKEITREMADKAEDLANEIVWADVPVNTYFFDTLEEAKKLPLRKDIKADEDISVVVVGDLNDPADCCACCGTHPSTSGQIGVIKIIHSEKYKGMNRFYVAIGAAALKDYREKHRVLDALGRKYTCDYKDLEKTLASAEQKKDELAAKYSELKKIFAAEEEKAVEKLVSDQWTGIYKVYSSEILSADDLQLMARHVQPNLPEGKMLVLISFDELAAMAVSGGDPACGGFIKENAAKFNGRGGGKPDFARAGFKAESDLKQFEEFVRTL